MRNFIFENLASAAPASKAIIKVSIMLLTGFLMTRVTNKLKLPNVTAYIVAGILIGPFGFHFVPVDIVKGMDFVPDIALAFIAFSTGEFFKFSTLRQNGLKVMVITLLEAMMATIVVFVLTYFILKLDLAFFNRAGGSGVYHSTGLHGDDDPAAWSQRRFCRYTAAGGCAG